MKTNIDIIDTGKVLDILKLPINDDSKLRLLDTTSITVSIIANRLQSLYLCEQKYSYSIQSQRYCRFDAPLDESTIMGDLKKFLLIKDQVELDSIIKDTRLLYLEMTKVKEGHENVVKKTLDDFEYGIPVEDARSILPMIFTANHIITMTGLEFIKLINMMIDNNILFKELLEIIESGIYSLTGISLTELVKNNLNKLAYVESVISKEEFDIRTKLVGDNYIPTQNVQLLDEPIIPLTRKSGIGALVCTNVDNVRDIYKSKTEEKMQNITERVTFDTGHTSISEHCNMGWVINMTVACYNQYVRHRHQKCYRVGFNDYVHDMPQSIMHSKFNTEYNDIITRLNRFIRDIKSKYYKNNTTMILVDQLYTMGHRINVIANSNLINEAHMGKKRNCNKAQSEIHNISIKKLDLMKSIIKSDKLVSMAAPDCINGKCKEGKNCCGNNSNVKELFRKED